MHAHYFQHVAFEGLGSIETWLEKAGYRIRYCPFYRDAGVKAYDPSKKIITTPSCRMVQESGRSIARG